MAAKQDNEEFQNAIRDIAQHAIKLEKPYDRVRCSEWARKLVAMEDDNLELAKVRNEYIQLLRIMVHGGYLHGPFSKPPSEANLVPLAECLGNDMRKKIPYLPRMGPIVPFIKHQSPDGRAYISVKQIPGQGVFCYMAVTPKKFGI